MKLALNQPILQFTNDGLQTWISRITRVTIFDFSNPIRAILLLSTGNVVIPFQRPTQYLYVFQYPQIISALLDECLELVSPCATIP